MNNGINLELHAGAGPVIERTYRSPYLLTAILVGAFTIGPDSGRAGDAASALQSVVSVLPQLTGRPENLDEPEGSGVVLGDGHYVLTANHVIGQANRILLRSSDGRIFSGQIVGRDKASDLALLRGDEKLTAMEFGSMPELGEHVCAIGNAFGLGLSLTCGTISAVHRSDVGFNAIEDFVQTDAAVNPGSSGGALVDDEGHLVGVLSAIFTKKSDANIGVNFAVSMCLAKRVFEGLKANGKMAWQFGGLGLRAVPPKGKTGRQGAMIVSVRNASSGENAGLKKGDVIVLPVADGCATLAGFVLQSPGWQAES